MPDPLAAAVRAVLLGTSGAPVLVFAAGVVSSFGPCALTRVVAVAGISSELPRGKRYWPGVSFTAGLAITYAGFGAIAGLLSAAAHFTHALYAALAAGCLLAAATTLLREPGAHRCSPAVKGSIGGAFLFGAAFAFVVSPCCTPVLTAVLAYGAQSGNTRNACLLLAAFALGHAAPVFAAAVLAQRVREMAARIAASDAIRVVTGGLLLSMSAYYGCLV